MKGNGRRVSKTRILVLAMFTAFVTLSCVHYGFNRSVPVQDPDVSWQEGWAYALPSGELAPFDAPARLEASAADGAVELRGVFPERLPEGTVFYLKTNYQPVQVYVGGVRVPVDGIYNGQTAIFRLEMPWVRVRVSPDMAGQPVRLLVGPGGSKTSVEVYQMLLGEEGRIRLALLNRSAVPLVLCLVMGILGLALMVFSWLERKKLPDADVRGFEYLAAFIVLAILWIFTDSNMQGAYYIGSRPYFLFNLYAYMLMPIPFVLFVRQASKRCKPALDSLLAFQCLVILVHITLALCGVFNLALTLTSTHLLLGLSIGTMLATCSWEYLRYHNDRMREDLYGSVLISIASVAALFQFYIIPSSDNAMFFRVGLLAFIIALSVSAFRGGVEVIAKAQFFEQLRIQEEEYRIAAKHSEKYILRFDMNTQTIEMQEETARRFGVPATLEDVPQCLANARQVLPESRETLVGFFEQMLSGKPSGSAVCCLYTVEGEPVWYHGDYTLIFDEQGAPLKGVVSFYDITDMREKELAYEKWQQNFEALPITSKNYYEYNLTKDTFDREESGMLPPMPSDVQRALSAVALHIANHYVYAGDCGKFLAFFDRKRLLSLYERGVRSEKIEFRRATDDATPLWTQASVQLLSDPYSSDIKCFLLLQDIDEEKKEAMKASARSNEDPLTGLLNRSALTEKMNVLLQETNETHLHALIEIDVDGFKGVNDTYGHQFGDKVLIDIANDLRAMMRNDDLVCRIGGDEYIICIRNIPADLSFLERKSSFILQALNKQFGVDVAISGSLGISIYPRDGKTFDELYLKADKALYHAKHHGKNRYVFYNEDLAGGDMTAPSASTMRFNTQDDAEMPEMPALPEQEQMRTLLIVDDVEMNRDILGEIFRADYNILMAGSGDEALNILQSSESSISAMLLDIIMPGRDGLSVLREMQKDAFLSTIPVVVISAAEETEYSIRAIDLGATDFVSKPIDPMLVRLRVKNAIHKRETDELRAQNRYLLVQKSDESRHQNQLRYLAEHDSLTKICNRAAFYQKTEALLKKNPNEPFVLISFDIEKFRVVNDIFGHDEGDRILRFIATRLQALVGTRGTYARIDTDNFCICTRYDPQKTLDLLQALDAEVKEYDLSFEILLCYGLYIVDDPTLPVNVLHDRAVLAKRTVKGNYLNRYAFYDEALRENLLKEQEIINEMDTALAQKEFDVYLQPKCRLDTGAIVGAEALVRWNHPVKGVLSPGQFIPVFEKNGFIMKLDAYVWERVCQLLRGWLDMGRANLPVRISTNISRVNLYNPNLCQTLVDLVAKYRIPAGLLELEITESAYSDNPTLLMTVISQLRDNGFQVQMDDFGSGYSSLNMLKEIPVDALKVDMRFLYGGDHEGRGGSILSSVVRMARWLRLPVITEGVETQEQASFLRSIGCVVAQGYLFYRPMPVNAFERLLAESRTDQGVESAYEDMTQLKALWSMDENLDVVLNCVAGGVGIYELIQDHLEALRANQEFYRLMETTQEDFFRLGTDAKNTLSEAQWRIVYQACCRARDTGEIVECLYQRKSRSGAMRPMRVWIKLLQKTEESALLSGLFEAADGEPS